MKNFISNYYNLQYLYFWSSQLFINLLIWVITHHDFTMVISYNLALVLIYLLFWLKPSIIQNLKYLFLIVFMFSLVLNKNYILLTFYTLLLFYFYIVKNKNTQWSIKFIDDYKKDFDIIESHLNNEFILFRPLRDFNVFLSFLLLLTPRFSNLFIEESWLLDTITYIYLVLVFVFAFNTLTLVLIFLVIVNKCNPNVKYVILQNGSFILIGGAALSLNFMGFHVINTSKFFEPLPIELSYLWQERVQGFRSTTGDGNFYGQVYKSIFHKLPPVDQNNFIDLSKTQNELKNFVSSETKTVYNKAIPFWLRGASK